ncbi:MAG TPA: hypothetical protein VHM30_10745 [Gemmatimonadaceae bacterium]|nr:hypothetical protein [Gemmatimonadaceae bacterium]
MRDADAASALAIGDPDATATLAVHALIVWHSVLAGCPHGECSGAGAGVSCTDAGAVAIAIPGIACAFPLIPAAHAGQPASRSWRASVVEASSAMSG